MSSKASPTCRSRRATATRSRRARSMLRAAGRRVRARSCSGFTWPGNQSESTPLSDAPDMNLAAEIALAQRLADAAREAIRPHFRMPVAAERKGDATPVTIADRSAEEAMRRILVAEVPQDGVHGEEFGITEGRSGRQWVLDPIDGTKAFLAGRATFGTLIALLVDGFPVLGVIDQPIIGERWLGVAGQQTTLNGQPVAT